MRFESESELNNTNQKHKRQIFVAVRARLFVLISLARVRYILNHLPVMRERLNAHLGLQLAQTELEIHQIKTPIPFPRKGYVRSVPRRRYVSDIAHVRSRVTGEDW